MVFVAIALVVLSAVVTALSLAVVSLYRLLSSGSTAESTLLSWPLSPQPGDSVTAQLNASLARVIVPQDGFIVVTSSEVDSYATIASTQAVAEGWDHRLIVLLRQSNRSEWTDRLINNKNLVMAEMSSDLFEDLNPQMVPLLLFVRDGLLVDAVVGLTSPSAIERFFGLVAAPKLPSSFSF